MKRFLFLLVLCFLAMFSLMANADVFAPDEQDVILKFPTDNGGLDWDELALRFEGDALLAASSADYYLGAVVALRTGARDQAKVLGERAATLAVSEADSAKSQLLNAFLNFYLSPLADRAIYAEPLVVALEAQAEADWLSGTSATVLVEHAYTASEPHLSKRVLDQLTILLADQTYLETQFWFINSHLKSAYTAALSPQQSASIDPFEFLESAIMIIADAQSDKSNPETTNRLRRLYYRSHVIDGVISSRRGSMGQNVKNSSLPLIKPFHPAFQTNCVDNVDHGRRTVRVRKEFGTGGMLLLIAFDEKGRGKFKQVIDAQPIKMKNEFMHRYYKQFASSMRITVHKDDPECQNGGEMIVPYSLSWIR